MLKLEVITPEKIAYSEDVDQVTIETTQGQITVLPHHIDLITTLKSGELVIKKGNQTLPLATGDGFAQISAEKVAILTDTAQKAEEINERETEEAKKRAQEALKERNRLSAEEFAVTAANLERALAQLRFKRKHSRHS